MGDRILPPAVTEVRLTSFKSYRRAVLPLAPLTVLCGPSGAGKTNALDALEVLSRFALGRPLAEALDGGGSGPAVRPVRGGAAGCAPRGRRGFLLGCTVATRHGPVRLELAVETDPEPRIVRERLSGHGRILLETLHPRGGFAAPGPSRGTVGGAWASDVAGGQIRATFEDDRLLTAQLPLRIAGATEGERLASMAAEEVLVALRGLYPSEPVPQLMRDPGTPGDGMLRRYADNIAAVVERIQRECRFRHGRLLRAVQAVSPVPVRALRLERGPGPAGAGERLRLLFEETAEGGGTELPGVPLSGVSDGVLRYLAFASALLTGPGVLQMDPVEVPDADRLLTVLAEDADAGMARGQQTALLRLAAEMCGLGHVRAVAAVHDAAAAEEVPEAALVHCRRDPATGWTVLAGASGPAAAPGPGGGPSQGPDELSDSGHFAGVPRQRGAGAVREVRAAGRLPGARVEPIAPVRPGRRAGRTPGAPLRRVPPGGAAPSGRQDG